MAGRFFLYIALCIISIKGAAQVPDCTQLSFPVNFEFNVPLDVVIQWDVSPNATSYILTVGTASGATDIVDNLDVGNVTAYTFVSDLPPISNIYVNITPVNSFGPATNCMEFRFSTIAISPPRCTNIIDPTDGATLVSVTANITWIRDFSATGYRMLIEENFVGGVRLLDNVDVGNGTNYKPPDFKPNTLYFVTMIPYNSYGPAVGCTPISFRTGDAPPPPLPLECSLLISPRNGEIGVSTTTGLSWFPVADATGYLLSVGTTTGGVDIVNNADLGNVTSFEFTNPLPEGQRIVVTLVPYNDDEIAHNCIEAFTVEGELIEPSVVLPKFFTPNNDGINDLWIVTEDTDFPITQVFIFNRYGKLLKQLLAGQSWNGTFNGKMMPSDTYWYIANLEDGFEQSGFFMLKR